MDGAADGEASARGGWTGADSDGFGDVEDRAGSGSPAASSPLGRLRDKVGNALRLIGAPFSGAASVFRHPTAEAQVTAGEMRLAPATDATATRLPGVEAALARIDFVFQRIPPKGDPTVPENIQAAALLLSDHPPTLDFQAVDLLHTCFSRSTRNSPSRVLMAIARNLTRRFGQTGRLPITSGKAWGMLDPVLFADEFAAQLAAICAFISDWQANQSSFLILEFPEIELIEYLFENLHPRIHRKLLVRVMEFKVLSSRRVGLLRRIPARIRRYIQDSEGRPADEVRAYLDDTIAFLDQLGQPGGFAQVAQAARQVQAEVEKIAAQLEAPRPDAGGAGTAAEPMAEPQPLHPVLRGLAGGGAAAPVDAEPHQPSSLPTKFSSPAIRRRFSKQQKMDAVLRVLQGEEREWVALSLGVRPDMIARWHQAFLSGGKSAFGREVAPPKVKPRAKAEVKAAVAQEVAAKAVGKAAKSTKPAAKAEPSMEELKGQLHALLETVTRLGGPAPSGSGRKK